VTNDRETNHATAKYVPISRMAYVEKLCVITIMRCNLSKAHETCNSFSSFCLHTVLIYLQPFHHNSPLKCAPQLKIAKNTTFLKHPIFGVQSHSRSSLLILLKSSSPVLVTISSMSMPIYKVSR